VSLTALLDPAVHLAYFAVTELAAALPGAVPSGSRIALAVLLVTWAARAALLPLAISAARARRASAAMSGEVARLQRRYAGDPARLGQELRAAYREAGVSPLAGLLPTVAQLPVISTMYRLVVVPVIAGHPNAVLNAVVLGVPLGGHWPGLLATAGVVSGTALGLAVLVAALAVLAWMSSRQATRAAGTAAAAGSTATTGSTVTTRSTATTLSTATTAAGTGSPVAMARLVRALPFVTVGFAVIAPPAVGLYLLAATAWTVTERALLAA
jgi:YidC/Oxa1 family membrane protein insertase